MCIRNQKEGVLCKAQFRDNVCGFLAKWRCPGLDGISCPILERKSLGWRGTGMLLQSPLKGGGRGGEVNDVKI